MHESEATTDWVKIAVPGGGATKIAAGSHHIIAINSVGHVLSWGIGAQGQLGHGNHKNVSLPAVVQFFIRSNIRALDLVCTNMSTVVLASDGIVYAWGLLEIAANGNSEQQRKYFINCSTLNRCNETKLILVKARNCVFMTNALLCTILLVKKLVNVFQLLRLHQYLKNYRKKPQQSLVQRKAPILMCLIS